MNKVFEITDSFTGQSFGYIHGADKKTAKIKAQKKANEVGYEVSLHQIIKCERHLIERYNPA